MNCETGLFIPTIQNPTIKRQQKESSNRQKGTECANTLLKGLILHLWVFFFLDINPVTRNKDKVIWGLRKTVSNVRHQPQWRLVQLFWEVSGQMFKLFDPEIQSGGLYNSGKSEVFIVRVIWFKNLNSPIISWGSLIT